MCAGLGLHFGCYVRKCSGLCGCLFGFCWQMFAYLVVCGISPFMASFWVLCSQMFGTVWMFVWLPLANVCIPSCLWHLTLRGSLLRARLRLSVLGVAFSLFLGMLGGTLQTWLILPVVICLSQRLSHACLSISFYTAKLRMAH